MRILFINSIQMFGGGEIWLFRAMRELEHRGHTVHLLCRPGVPLEVRARANGFRVHALPMPGDFDPGCICRTFGLIRRLKPDVVCTNMDRELRFGGVAARIAGVKAVVPRRGIDHPLKNTWAYRFSYDKVASGVIANSNATKQSLLRNSPWLDPKKIRVIYNGVENGRFQGHPSADLRKEWQIPKNAFLFGFVGQLDSRKGVETLLGAFRKLAQQEPGAWLVLVGEGRLESKLRRMAQECRGRVVFAGYRDDVENVMKTMDVLVLPSLWEGFGIVLIEAMAARKPVITTNTSNMPEIVTQGVDGVLIPPSDALALAQAMRSMVQSPVLVRNMGAAGKRTVGRRFTLAKMTDAIESFFSECAAI